MEEEVESVEEVSQCTFLLYFVSMCTILYVCRLSVRGCVCGKGRWLRGVT